MGALDQVHQGNAKVERKKPGQSGASSNPITVSGYQKSEVVSALQKTIRRGQEREALYWAMELMASDQAWHMWKRLVVIAAEDVGLADPDMVMRIMLMKQAHDLGREDNIPFLAVMLLCRSSKNREADDASWYYSERRRKENWKIPMPPEAVDGHTRTGKQRLYAMARVPGNESFEQLWNREFYFDAALLKNYVPDEFHGEPDPYRREMMEWFGLPFETYDIDSCPQPRMLSGGGSGSVPGGARGPEIEMVPYVEQGSGEKVEDVWRVKSFTGDDTWYVVSLVDETCTCPAYENGGGGYCKHLVGLLNANRDG